MAIFREMLTGHASDYTLKLPAEKLTQLPHILAEVYRSVSRFKLQLYPGVEEIVGQLHEKYRLAALSDGQSAWAVLSLIEPRLDGFLVRHFAPHLVAQCG